MKTNESTLRVLKYLALSSAGAYAFYAYMHKRNAALSGRDYVDSGSIVDAVMPFVNINPTLKPLVQKAAKKIVDELTGQHEIIDVTPKDANK